MGGSPPISHSQQSFTARKKETRVLYNIFDFDAVIQHSYYGAKGDYSDTLICPDTQEKVLKWEAAAYGFISRYIEPLPNFTHLLVTRDMGIEYRKAVFPEYKQHRKNVERSPLEKEQINLLKTWAQRLLAAIGATQIGVEGVESDDIIAWLCQAEDFYAVVHTVDGDLVQLASDKVQVNLKGESYVGSDCEYKGHPARLTSFIKSIVGDPSDGYKGIPGMGPAAVDKLVSAFGHDGLEELQHILDTNNYTEMVEVAASCEDKIYQSCSITGRCG